MRRGGRDARRELRREAEDISAIPFAVSSRALRPTDDQQIRHLHSLALCLLAEVGIKAVPPDMAQLLIARGAFWGDQRRLCIPEQVVAAVWEKRQTPLVLAAQDSNWDLEFSDRHSFNFVSGSASQYVDDCTGEYRDTSEDDIYHAALLCQELPHIHGFSPPMVVSSDSLQQQYLLAAKSALRGTRKHLCWDQPPKATAAALSEIVTTTRRGAIPTCSQSLTLVRSPLCCDSDGVDALKVALAQRLPIFVQLRTQIGVSSPANLALSVAQMIAESLFSLLCVKTMDNDAPVIVAPCPWVVDLRSGQTSGFCAEMMLVMTTLVQWARAYGLFIAASGATTDSKRADHQAGVEKAAQHMALKNAGAHVLLQAAGNIAGQLGFSLAAMLLDNDSLGTAMRYARGLGSAEQNDIQIIRQVIDSEPGHFLAHTDTMQRMQCDFYHPTYFDRFSPSLWQSLDRTSPLDRAWQQVESIITRAK